MAVSGFSYFIAYMQERKEKEQRKEIGLEERKRAIIQRPKPTKPTRVPKAVVKPEPRPKRIPLIQLADPFTMSNPTAPQRIEDYTGSLCLLHNLTDLTPAYSEVLMDIEDFERAAQFTWLLIYLGDYREPRVVSNAKCYLHRFVTDSPKGMVVDHQFHNTLDCRKGRLRVCTVRENNLNRRPRRQATSRYKGVQLCKKSGRWKVICGARGSAVYLGTFDTEVAAAIVYNQYAAETYGSMAYQNAIPETF